VIRSLSAGSLTLLRVTATRFFVGQTTSTNGGGSFLYTDYDGLFTLTVTDSTFLQESATYTGSDKSTVNTLKVEKGSIIHLAG
jgi:hypothetical protein